MNDDTPDPRDEDGGFPRPEEVSLQDVDISIEVMWRLYGEINEWIRAQDFKAGVVLAANGVIIVAGAALVVGGGSFGIIVHHHASVVLDILAAIVTVIISSAFAALCLVPPLRVGEAQSPLFFAYVARHYHSARAYEADIRATLTTADAHLTQITHQVWTSSRSVYRKLTYIDWAIRFFIASLVFSLLAVLSAFL